MASNTNKEAPACVLLSTEVELYVQALQTFSIEEIGSKKYLIYFYNQHIFISNNIPKDGQVNMSFWKSLTCRRLLAHQLTKQNMSKTHYSLMKK